jgi:WD40 repeat protein/DNA-binding SARP family transcriptional activator
VGLVRLSSAFVMTPLSRQRVHRERRIGISPVNRIDEPSRQVDIRGVEIGVLGPLTLDGVATRAPRRDRVVLEVLVVRVRDIVSAEQMADALWREEPPVSWAKVVQGCVVRLRKILGASAIETTPRGYRLAVPAESVDALRFERLLGSGRERLTLDEPDRAVHLLDEALGLWRGPALDELEDWEPGMMAARRLEELRLDAEELVLEAALRAGRHREVLGAARSRTEEAPLRERRWALLALARYQSGQQAEALRTISEVRTLLSIELGLEPGPDLLALEEAIRRQDPALVADAALPQPRPTCPYRGLVPYDVADAEDFYGRARDVAACQARLIAVGAVTVVGPSGSGKSSLIRAGLAAGLLREGRRVVVVTPGVHPLDSLAGLSRTGPAPVLVVDQCEEAVALAADPDERIGFFASLTAYAERAPVVIAVRADRLGDLSTHPGLTRLVERSLYLLNPMSREDLVEAIEGPARGAGLRLEPGLVDLLVREIEGEPGALPLLSHALRATWEHREGNTLTVAGYQVTGGVRGAVAQSAEAVYETVPPDQRPALRDLLLRLVAPNPEGDPMRSRLPRRLVEGTPHHEELLETLVTARLVTSDEGVIELAHEALVRAWPRLQDWLDDDTEGQRVLRHLVVAADTWNTMGRPHSELYRGTRLGKALEWQQRARPELTPSESDFLVASRQLEEAEERSAHEQAVRQVQINRRLRALLAGAALLAVSALVATLFAVDRGQEADHQRRTAVAQRDQAAALALAAASRSVLRDDPALGLALAAESAQATSPSLLQATGALAQARLAFDQDPIQQVGEPLAGRFTTMTFSPDGHLFAGAAGPAGVKLWDPTSGRPAALRLHGPVGPVRAVAFSADGNLLASAGHDGLQLWDTKTGEPADVRLHGRVRGVNAVAFTPDGSMLATGGSDGVRFWNPETGQPAPLGRLGDPGRVTAVTFSPDSSRVVTVNGNFRAQLWALGSGKHGVAMVRSIPSVVAAGFLPDGRLATSGISFDNDPRPYLDALRLWNARTGKLVGAPLAGRTVGFVYAMATSPVGHLVATVSGDSRVQLWDPTTGKQVGQPLPAHSFDTSSLVFSQDGSLLATAGSQGSVRLWRVEPSGAISPKLPGGSSESLAFGPDGASLATVGENLAGGRASLRVWNTETGRRAEVSPKRLGRSKSVSVSPDGRLLASASTRDTVSVRDVSDGHLVRESIETGQAVFRLAFSPDDSVLAGAGVFKMWLWDVATGKQITEMSGGTLAHVRSLAWSPDGELLATASTGDQGAVRLWNPSNGTLVATWFPDRPTGVESLAFSPDASLLASGDANGAVHLWDPATGRAVGGAMTGHDRFVFALAFSPDGRLLVTGGWDTTVRLWDTATGDPVGGPIHSTGLSVDALVFSPDGSTLAVDNGDDVLLWDWNADDACEVATGYVARTQIAPYLPPDWRPRCDYLR